MMDTQRIVKMMNESKMDTMLVVQFLKEEFGDAGCNHILLSIVINASSGYDPDDFGEISSFYDSAMIAQAYGLLTVEKSDKQPRAYKVVLTEETEARLTEIRKMASV